MLRFWKSASRYDKALLILFALTIPFVHAQVRGDGVGYYAHARSLLIDHNLQFRGDWDDPWKEIMNLPLNGHLVRNPITKTGHLPNYWSVGPAVMWAPFLVAAHWIVLGLNAFGWKISADGRSWPYLLAMAGASTLYGFSGLFLSYKMAKKYVDERWAFIATLGIWLGTTLLIYIYVDPSWSHEQSVFCGALFLWYWLETRNSRTNKQWIVLGLISGLMLDVRFDCIVFLLAPLLESLAAYVEAWQSRQTTAHLLPKLFYSNFLYAGGVLVAFLPTLITRQIIFGSPFAYGPYSSQPWNWKSPAFVGVLFSSNHGLVVFTPILVLAMVGLFLLSRGPYPEAKIYIAISLAFYCLISFFPWWDSTVGLGNRYFIALTPLFVIGLAYTFSRSAGFWANARAATWRFGTVTALLVIWNLGLVYQWCNFLLPPRSQVYWDEVIYNQFRVVPARILQDLAKKASPQQNADLK